MQRETQVLNEAPPCPKYRTWLDAFERSNQALMYRKSWDHLNPEDREQVKHPICGWRNPQISSDMKKETNSPLSLENFISRCVL